MPIARITGSGLAAMACAVGLLWTCVVAEQVTHNAAVAERTRVIREVREMQQRTVPVSDPSPLVRHRPHVTAG